MTHPVPAELNGRVVPRGVWWHVYPLGFLAAERTATPDQPITHRLPRLIPWLDYCVELGLQGWVLGPLFASASHGYDTTDHFRVDPRLGDERDLIDLLDAAHERGLKIVLDGVFNHVGRQFAQFQRLVIEGPDSPAAAWFHLTGSEGSEGPDVEVFEGHDQLVTLNHGNPEVLAHVVSVIEYWNHRGVDGWRLDAAYAAPVSFWRQVSDRVKAGQPATWLFGEVIHGDYQWFVSETGLDSVTQYELWKAIASSINDGNFFEFAHALGRNNEFLATFTPVTFLGNHDTTRIASAVADPAFLPHATVILFSLGGTPVVYAGDEQGFRGVKYEREGGDDEVRPPFPEGPEEFSALGAETFDLHRSLVAMRNQRPWLVDAHSEVTHLTNEQIVYVTTARSHHARVAVALNLADAPAQLPLVPGDWHPVVGDGAPGPEGVFLPAHGWVLMTDGGDLTGSP